MRININHCYITIQNITEKVHSGMSLVLLILLNPLSPKIDFYVDLLICATSWASNHKFMLLLKIFQETYYL